MIALYPHNERAYLAARKMLEQKQRVAIVHPTGTGKSFIAFRFVEENPQMRALWLSPSEYIFRIQLENIRKSDPEIGLENLQFMTYAKLMLLSDEAMTMLAPDLIILDEFHRCGAEHWGDGVDNLIDLYPKAKVLGLSATSVRYLDNQRDMAQELFDGNIASEMTLGEAIVRGILPAPKYVTTVFKYHKELEDYQKRIRGAQRSSARRKNEEKLLQALRRALEKADGLDSVFARHMQEKGGKYIVFCANVEHMREMTLYEYITTNRL